MHAHILSLNTTSTPWVRSKGQTVFFLLKVIILHIKLKGMNIEHFGGTYSVLARILKPQMWSNGQNIFFLKVVRLHIKLKVIEHRAPCKHIFYP